MRGVASPDQAGEGDVAPVTRLELIPAALEARARGARLLVDARVASRLPGDWLHPHVAWAMAALLDETDPVLPLPRVGPDAVVHPTAILYPGVVVGARARIEAYAVVGGVGFGFAPGPGGKTRAIPHRGGVVLGDDVFVGAHTTVHAGVLGPTRVGDRTRLDAHVHVAHNCDVGPDCFLAAQTGLAGSVRLGRGVLVGGQAGFADHVTVGDGARIAAKSGVIGDVPAGATYGGYPAMSRVRWLRGVAAATKLARGGGGEAHE